ncbi:hypothetical protein SBOR_6125 [Sclerotinia borealis F-4128]|uniref:Uncharacterized protein n=1 Tax=Sclerotinia borealis (strain F-4128) TaxID=1432307 RepID=W9CC84_SCLBF|nr:hypothetical protein SBOR_6125 [Sclerotinia borealis F-4128]
MSSPIPHKRVTTDPNPITDSSPADEWILELQQISSHVNERFLDLARIDYALEDALKVHRRRILLNTVQFQKDYPTASRLLLQDFNKAMEENDVVDVVQKQHRKLKDLYDDAQKKYTDMSKAFDNIYPDFERKTNNYYNARHTYFPLTDTERASAFFANRSIQEVNEVLHTNRDFRRFKLVTCEKSFPRTVLPRAYRALFEGLTYPDNPGSTSYDAEEVMERMINPRMRSPYDRFRNVLATVWVQHPKSDKYEPLPNRLVFQGACTLERDELLKKSLVYVEWSDERTGLCSYH